MGLPVQRVVYAYLHLNYGKCGSISDAMFSPMNLTVLMVMLITRQQKTINNIPILYFTIQCGTCFLVLDNAADAGVDCIDV